MNARALASWIIAAQPLNGPASVEPEVTVPTLGVGESEAAPESASSTGDTGNDWLCAWCQNRVASEKERFPYDGKDEFSFTNPEQMHFTILTFARTHGCHESGKPTLDHTWFPGYAWSYCQCNHCGQHLGWYYTGHIQFAGLIKDRIVRALYRRN